MAQVCQMFYSCWFSSKVLAFTGAPASFPVQQENRDLHKFLVWDNKIISRAINFIRHVLPIGSFVGIHLRNGVDWVIQYFNIHQLIITMITNILLYISLTDQSVWTYRTQSKLVFCSPMFGLQKRIWDSFTRNVLPFSWYHRQTS